MILGLSMQYEWVLCICLIASRGIFKAVPLTWLCVHMSVVDWADAGQ